MKLKRITAIVSALLIATTVLSGCGTSNNSTSQAKPDTFTYGIDGDPGNSVNVITTSDRYGLTEIKALYSPLYMYNADKVQYFLAESMTPSADHLSYTAKLRKNVKWSDGKPFTADDVVFTYDQMLKESNGGWAYSQLIFDGKPVKVEKVDDYTVKFTLPTVSSAAMELLGDIFIMPKHIYDGEANIEKSSKNAKPVGTGPYKLAEYKAGQYVKLVANDNYFLGKPKIKNVVYRIIEDANTAQLALQKGELNALVVQPADISKIQKSNKNLDVIPYGEGRVAYMDFNLSSKLVQNKDVRKAILYALNRKEIIDAAYVSEKYAQPVYTFLPNESKYKSSDTEKYDYNMTKAKELLQKAGVKGLKLKLAYTNNNVAQQKQAAIVQQELKAVGIDVELLGMDSTALSEKMRKVQTDFDLVFGGYIMGIDPDTFNSLFTSNSEVNYMHYKNSEIDRLFNEGRVEIDEAKRKEIYNQIQKIMQDDAVFYPILSNNRVLVIDKRIGGIKEAGLVPVYTFEDMSKLYYK